MLTRAATGTNQARFVPAYPARNIVSMPPILCFLGALATDVTYWRTSDIQWSNFSAWLLAIGMVLGGLSLIVELVHLFRTPRPHRAASSWPGVGVMVVALAVALANNFIHARDGWTSVVPSGLILSAITVVLMIVASAMLAHFEGARIGELP